MAETELHQRLVRRLVNHARAYGVVVERAAIRGGEFPWPYAIGGYVPDMIGWVGDRPVIGEAEIGSALGSAHTYEQLRAFSDASGPTGQLARIALAVPGQWRERARRVAGAAGIPARRLVVVPPPTRRRPAPAAFPRPLQRGREQRVPLPGTLFERGRTTVSSLSQPMGYQAELNELARQIARERLAEHPLLPR